MQTGTATRTQVRPYWVMAAQVRAERTLREAQAAVSSLARVVAELEPDRAAQVDLPLLDAARAIGEAREIVGGVA